MIKIANSVRSHIGLSGLHLRLHLGSSKYQYNWSYIVGFSICLIIVLLSLAGVVIVCVLDETNGTVKISKELEDLGLLSLSICIISSVVLGTIKLFSIVGYRTLNKESKCQNAK